MDLACTESMPASKQYCRFCGEQQQPSELIDFSQNQKIYNDVYVKLYFINADYVQLDDESLPKTICRCCYQTFDRAHCFLVNVRKVQGILRMIFNKAVVKVEKTPVQETVDLTSRASTPDSPRMVIDECEDKNATKDEAPTRILPLIDIATTEYDKHSREKGKKTKVHQHPTTWSQYGWLCPQCDLTFPDVLELMFHCTKEHQTCAQYRCRDCKIIISKYEAFIYHVKEHHKNLR